SLGAHLLASSSSPAASPNGVLRVEHRGAPGEALSSTVWPTYGQAAVQVGQSQVQAGPNQHAAAIASVAKVMTAFLVLRDHPLRLGQDGPTIALTDADVADTDRRRGQRESVVPIAAGEQLTERQALQALLLPSANNIAAVLARWEAGSDDAAGGCFAFRAIRWIDGKRTTITGVVLGQPGHDQIAAGLAAADAMVDRIAGHSRRQVRAMPDLRQRTLPPRTAPRSHRPRPYVGGQSA